MLKTQSSNKFDIKLARILEKLGRTLPKFPDGRINYSNAKIAPVISCCVKFQNKILILKRSDKVHSYKGKWNFVGGYLDEPKPVLEKALEELNEELGIKKDEILNIKTGKFFETFDKDLEKTWLVYPILAELKQKTKIKLDWEHTDSKWITPQELENYEVVPGLIEGLKKMLD